MGSQRTIRRAADVSELRDFGAESVLIGAGGRAILLQLAQPAVGHGVARHSDFASRPLDRLRNTLSYVYALSYGTPQQLSAVLRSVNRAHAPVRSRSAAEGTPAYSAFDPQLQLWVAATLYDSAIDIFERIYGPLDDEVADRVYREYAVIGASLQMPEELWPADRAAFREYWDSMLPTLRTDEVTRGVANQLLHPDTGPLWLRAAMPLARLATTGLVPEPVREQFEFDWSPARQRRFDRLISATRAVYPVLPRGIRQRPRDRLLAAIVV